MTDDTPRRARVLLDRWFGPEGDPDRERPRPMWFGGPPEFDDELRQRFAEDYQAAAAGRLSSWEAEPLSCLALLLLLDQIPRNIFRGTWRAYATDAMARAVANRALDRGFDQSVPLVWRRFFYLPFHHSENLADQQRSVALFEALPPDPERGETRRHTGRYLDAIARFGRFPHRNGILGRVSTQEERAWLKEHRRPMEITIESSEPFADGKEFGAAGAYLRVQGKARGWLDPDALENRVIADIDKAPRNDRGLIAYETDFFLLRPADLTRTRGVLVYDVTNRGNKRLLQMLDDAPGAVPAAANDPKNAADAGLAFTLGRGYTILWSGWDPDAPRADNGLGARFPVASRAGNPVSGRIRHEFHIGTRGPGKSDLVRLPYPATTTDKGAARLSVRDREGDPRTEIPAEDWEFVDARTIRLLPPGTLFAPFRIWDFWYEATGAKVLGIGFAAVRDLVSHLRYASGGPLETAGIRHALAFGNSQSGRFLRHFLELGMNADNEGRRVFDGVMTNVAGAGKVFANHRFGMPGRTATQHEDRRYPENWFPFGSMAATDPFSRRAGAILGGHKTDPKIIEVNSATEYWQKGASLVHTDPGGSRDAELPANVRVYMNAGTQHGGRPGVDTRPGPCLNPRNPHSATPALRALFAALEDWVVDGAEPPRSRVPRVADGTAVPAEAVRMPAIPGVAIARRANRILPPGDWVDPPAEGDNAYGTLVCAVDADGNEAAGIRSPSIAVPLGTFTGWNLYRAQPCELCDRDGSFIPFARTRAERETAGDPRPSLEERYGSRSAYAARVRAAAEALVAERLLLPDDAAAFVAAAEACDRFEG
jgi:uncharacterized protein (DUF924 family)